MKRQVASHQSEVELVHGSLTELSRQAVRRLLVQSKQDGSGGRPVQSMDRIHEMVDLVPDQLKQSLGLSGMSVSVNEYACGFLDRHEVLILEQNLNALLQRNDSFSTESV
jgi:hypothetical protein